MSTKIGLNRILFLYRLLTFISFTGLILMIGGCIPTTERSYKTPEARGFLVHFTPSNRQKFTPVVNAKIYYQSYPETVVYSDKQGAFVLPAVTKTEAKLLMFGHALINSSIIIEYQKLTYIALAKATLNSRHFEEINLDSIILPNEAETSHDEISLENKSSWPCDLPIIQSLDQALTTAQLLADSFPRSTIESKMVNTYANSHYAHTTQLLHEAKNSCRWQDKNITSQREQRIKIREYFSKATQKLDTITIIYDQAE